MGLGGGGVDCSLREGGGDRERTLAGDLGFEGRPFDGSSSVIRLRVCSLRTSSTTWASISKIASMSEPWPESPSKNARNRLGVRSFQNKRYLPSERT